MKNLLKVAALVAVILPSQAWAEKTNGDKCKDAGGTWWGDPIGSFDKGACIFFLRSVANSNVGTAAIRANAHGISAESCKAAGGIVSGDKCKMGTEALSKYESAVSPHASSSSR